jgi:CDP-glycerol glycerophosphotransferase (TagB/SpsB family)
MSLWRENDEKWISDLIKFCNKKNIEIVIKIHPKYEVSSHENSEKKINAISKMCYGFKFFISYKIDLITLLSASDLVITDYSNVGISAIIFNKPLLSFNSHKEKWDDYPQRVDKFGASIYIDNYQDLENKIMEILIENKHLEELDEGRKKIINKFNFQNDGKAGERIYNILVNQTKNN